MSRSASVRSLSLALMFALALAPASSSAQEASTAFASSQLRTLQHDSEEVESGLAAVRRELLSVGVRGNDSILAAHLVLTFEDHFALLSPISATFALDGVRLFTSTDRAEIESGAIYSGAIPSGPHVLSLELRYQGDVLYTTGYRYAITSSHVFGTTLGRTTHVRVIGHDRDVVAAPADRYGIEYATTTDPVE